MAEIVRQAGKDPLGAAAALGGALRHSKVRSLLAQAGVPLGEQIELNRTRVCGMCRRYTRLCVLGDRFMSAGTRPDR